MKLFFILISLILINGGCAWIPKIEKNSIVEINNLPTESQDISLTFNRENWWKGYRDENLDELLSLILQENLELKKAVLNIEKAMEEINLAASGSGPFLNMIGQIQRERFSENDLTFGAVSGSKLDNYGKLGLSGQYDIDLFKKVSSLVKAGEYMKEASLLSSKWIEISLTAQGTLLYGYWQFLTRENNSLKERVAILEKLSKLNQSGVDIGIESIDTFLQIQQKLRESQIVLEKNIAEQKIVENTLNLLSADNQNEKISDILKRSKKNSTTILKYKLFLPNEISSEVIKTRPDIGYYLELINAQSEKLKHYQAGFYPQFSISGTAYYGAYGLSKVFKYSSVAGLIGAGMTFPIFKGGELRSQYKIAGIDLNIFIEEYNEALLKAFQQVNNQLVKAKEAEKIFILSEKSASDCYRLYKRDVERNKLGLQSLYATEYSRYQWLEAKIALEQAQYNLFSQQVNLVKALGGMYD